MDRFDEVRLTLKDKQISELRDKCICAHECPTYNTCASDAKELLYCVYGKSFRCLTDDLGCICPACPVIEELGLVNLTFCLLGSEADQRYLRNIGRSK